MKTTGLKLFIEKAKKVKQNITIPILENVLIKDGEIHYTNLDISVSQKLEGLEEVDECLIKLSNLVKIVDKLKDVEIEILSEKKEIITSKEEEKRYSYKVYIASDKGNFEFTSSNPEEFPLIPVCKQNHIGITEKDVELIKKAITYTGDSEVGLTMMHVFVDKNHIIATNTHKLAFYETESERDNTLLLSKEVIKLMDKEFYSVLSKIEVTEQKEIKILNFCLFEEKSKLMITFESFVDKYPNWQDFLPNKNDYTSKLTIGEKDLKETLDMCSLSMNPSIKIIVFENNTEEKHLTISTNDIDYGKSYSRKLMLENSGDSIRIGVAQGYLMDILNTEKEKTYEFNFTSPDNAIVINGNILIMPMMLSNAK